MSRLRLLLNDRSGVYTPPPSPVVLKPLELGSTVFQLDAAPAAALSAIVGKSPGSVLAIVDDDGTFALNAEQDTLLKGLTDYAAGPGTLQIMETLPGAVGSPRSTSLEYVVVAPAATAEIFPGPGWTDAVPQPAPTVFDDTTIRTMINLMWTHDEVFTSDLAIPVAAHAEFQAANLIAYVEARCRGNSVIVSSKTRRTKTNPRTGQSHSISAFWFDLQHAETIAATGEEAELYFTAHSKVPAAMLTSTIGPFKFFARSAQFDTILKVAKANGTYGGETPTYWGVDPIKQCIEYKKTHPNEVVGIKILDDGLKYPIGEVSSANRVLNAKYKTTLFTRQGCTAQIGDGSLATIKTQCDKFVFGVGIVLNLPAMAPTGQQPINIGDNGIRSVFLWGCTLTYGTPEADGLPGWTGQGAECLYKGSMPAGNYVYEALNETKTVHYAFCDVRNVGPFGIGYSDLTLCNHIREVTGSVVENPRGAVYGNIIEYTGGSVEQPGLRGFHPAIRLDDKRSAGARPAYVSLQKVPINGNASLPLTILDGGSGYPVDGTWSSDLAGLNPAGGAQYSPELIAATGFPNNLVGANCNITIVGGVVTAAAATKSGHYGAGGRVGDRVTPVIVGNAPTRPAVFQVGGNIFLWEGASEATAVVVEEYLCAPEVLYDDFVDFVNANWENYTATDLDAATKLESTYLTRTTVSSLASGISKSAGRIMGGSGTFHVGVDVHRNCIAMSAPRPNIIVMHNDFSNAVECSPYSFGRSSKPNGVAIVGNTWHDRTPDLGTGLNTQQGYWQGDCGHFVFAENSGAGSPSGVRWFFGTSYTATPYVSIRNNILQSHLWAIPRDPNVFWKDNLFTLMSQAAVDALSEGDDGASKGLGNAAIATIFPGIASLNFTPSEAARLSNGVMPGAFNADGTRKG